MKIALNEINKSIPDKVTLVAVSKTKPIPLLELAYNLGIRNFGENRVQEIVEKQEGLPKDIKWHFIGHLQRNKVKYIAPFVHLIHSVDSVRLLNEINKCAKKNNRKISCLLQFHIAEEENKFGLSLEESITQFGQNEPNKWENIIFCGVMGMATFTNDSNQLKKEFSTLKSIFETLKKNHFVEHSNFKEISMGMSQDYIIAIEEGSTMVRVGSALFGKR